MAAICSAVVSLASTTFSVIDEAISNWRRSPNVHISLKDRINYNCPFSYGSTSFHMEAGESATMTFLRMSKDGSTVEDVTVSPSSPC